MSGHPTVYQYGPGLCHVPSYQISGQPWLTGAFIAGTNPNNGEIRIDFPFVTKEFTVINKTQNPIQITFDTRANTDVITYRHYTTLPTVESTYTYTGKTKSVWISMSSSVQNSEFELHAELTAIPARDMFVHSGSGINSVGP